MTLTDHQRRHLVHCLRVAATQFDKDAKVIHDARIDRNSKPEDSGLYRDFTHYAADARDLADLIEDALIVIARTASEVKP